MDESNCGKLEFRYATKRDVAEILYFIKELAAYEKMENEVVATEELLREWLFEKKKAEVLFAVIDGVNVGFALFFHNFSTFLGRAGMYLEDLYVKPEYRGKGYGKSILQKLAQIAVERGCGRLEWWCLDWNQPSIDFYLSMGAEAMKDWTVYRVAGNALDRLADCKADKHLREVENLPMDKKVLYDNLDKIHTTDLGKERIAKNLSLGSLDVVQWCQDRICSDRVAINRNGKNWYIEDENCVITVNASSYTIITAHKKK